jgi:glycosyltransferase involved in cell wall biosynthesis
MKYNPSVSVIIPVYNVENYLHQCLDSVLNQTLSDIEIICVNDESTDSSLDILEEYAARDSRVKIITQKNAGAGAARNTGLRTATGEYLSFLDSDDFFELDMLEKAYSTCLSNKLDFVVFRSDIYNNDRNIFVPQYATIRTDLLPRKEIFSYRDIEKDIFKVFVGWAWDKLFRREFVISNNLLFQEQRTTNDLLFVFSALVKAKRIMVLDDVLAHHRTSLNSSLSRTREKSWRCFYNALLALRDELKASGIYEEVEQSYINYALHFSLWNLNTLTGSAYEKLYNSIKCEFFQELGIPKHGRNYFWNKGEYRQYLKIMKNKKVPAANNRKPQKCNVVRALLRSIKNNGLKYALHKTKYEIFGK